MKKEKETRSTKKCDYNIEELRDGTGKKILAGVIRYNTRSDPEAVYDEKLAPSVFTKTIKDGADVYCNVAHADKWSQIVGSTKSGTLRLENKPDGLYFYLDQIDTQASKDAFTLVSLGILRGVSFEFEDVNSVWGFDAAQQRQTRLIKEQKLKAISIGVLRPYYVENQQVVLNNEDERTEEGINEEEVRTLETEKVVNPPEKPDIQKELFYSLYRQKGN